MTKSSEDSTRSTPSGGRDDDTVQTILDRASRRARRVSQSCLGPPPKGLRKPEPGTADRVDPTRLARCSAAPQNATREDAFELGLAARLGRA